MKLTQDESRALAFVAFLLTLSAIARYATAPAPIHTSGAGLDLAALEQASQAKLDAQTVGKTRGRSAGRPKTRAAGPDTAIDPNRATVADLAALPKISQKMAEAIVRERDSGTDFESAEDLAKVRGITRKTISQIAGKLTIPRGDTTSVAAGSPSHPIDVNRATLQDLESVPGIGPALAKKIYAHRTQNGPFRSIDDLLGVNGIGPATLGRLRPYLMIGP